MFSAGIRNNLVAGLVFVFLFQWLGYRRGNLTRAQLVHTALMTIPRLGMRFISLILACITLGRTDIGHRYYLSTGGIKLSRPFQFFVVLNILLGLANLVPLPPLDGGKLAVWTFLPFILSDAGVQIYHAVAHFLFIPFIFIINMMIDYHILESEIVEVCEHSIRFTIPDDVDELNRLLDENPNNEEESHD